jgi:hypothetical protein
MLIILIENFVCKGNLPHRHGIVDILMGMCFCDGTNLENIQVSKFTAPGEESAHARDRGKYTM